MAETRSVQSATEGPCTCRLRFSTEICYAARGLSIVQSNHGRLIASCCEARTDPQIRLSTGRASVVSC